jgi:hypothetical protein
LLIIKATGRILYNCPRLKKWNCMKELPNIMRVFMCEFSIVFNMQSPLFIDCMCVVCLLVQIRIIYNLIRRSFLNSI